MSHNEQLSAMTREERLEFCRKVLESLSDIVEGTAPDDLCERVDTILGDCQPFHAYCATLEATIRLAGDCRDVDPPTLRSDRLRRCIEEVRDRLARDRA